MDIIDFNEAEVSEAADFSAIGELARKGLDELVGGAIAYPRHWAGWTIESPSAVVLRFTPGRLFKDQVVYAAPQAIDLNVQIYLPFVPGDTKWIALLARGTSSVDEGGRLVETDVATGATVLVQLPKYKRREVQIIVQDGIAGPTPQKPTVADTECCLGYVLLSVSGIQTIVPGEQWRLKSLYEVDGRLSQAELLLAATIRRVSTLETDLANIAARLKDIPRREVIRQMQRNLAVLVRKAALPPEALFYWYDPGLLMGEWDRTHPNWLARVREGIRFSYANERDARIELLDIGNTAVTVTDHRCLPAWTEATRIAVEGSPDGSKNISQLVHTVTTAIERSVSRSSVDYGPTISVCENNAEWSTVGQQAVGALFAHNGETFRSLGLVTPDNDAINPASLNLTDPSYIPDITIEDIYGWNASAGSEGHRSVAVQQVEYRYWTETYWDYVVTEYGINGSVYGQTFLCATATIATSIDLYFPRVDSSGDVHLFVCDTDPTAKPAYEKVLAKCTLPAAALTTGWNKFSIKPTLLQNGKRYAWFAVTTGNHALGYVGNSNPDNAGANKYAQGTMFWSTDGAWAQGSPGEDFMFRLNSAQFASTRTVVEFAPLTLDNGMTEFRLLYPGWAPEGTALEWEIQPSGDDQWYRLIPYQANPLNGLPALCRLRATFVGTTDLMPMIELSDKARSLTGRHRSDMIAVSRELTLRAPCSNHTIETVVDNFNAAHHTAVNKLITPSGAVLTATSTTSEIDIAKPTRRTITSFFTSPTPIDSVRVRIDMTTDSVSLVPFVQNVSYFGE